VGHSVKNLGVYEGWAGVFAPNSPFRKDITIKPGEEGFLSSEVKTKIVRL